MSADSEILGGFVRIRTRSSDVEDSLEINPTKAEVSAIPGLPGVTMRSLRFRTLTWNEFSPSRAAPKLY
jgi:hypothetical protein